MPRRSEKSKVGSINSINVVGNGNYLRISIAGKHFLDGKRKFLSLGLKDCDIDRADAEVKVSMMRSDLTRGMFDDSLDRYQSAKQKSKTEVSDSISQVWDFYLNYKSAKLKESTISYLQHGLGRLIHLCPHQQITAALFIRNWLLANTTASMAKRVLLHLNAAVKWAIKTGLCKLDKSPFVDMAADLPKHRWEEEGSPNAFSPEEKDLFIRSIYNHTNSSVSHYGNFIAFLFLTGCRPSEAIGLRYKDLDLLSGFIQFRGSIVRVKGKAILSKGSKNNKQRKFRINSALNELLSKIVLDKHEQGDLCFKSKRGKTIEYSGFSRLVWKEISTEICQRHTTPYSARDTFITEQLTAGIPAATVAAWCDTSINQIQKRYLDPRRAEEIEPV
jgi:integrase